MRRKIFAWSLILCLMANVSVAYAQEMTEEPEIVSQMISEKVSGSLLDADSHCGSGIQSFALAETNYQEAYGQQLEEDAMEVYDILKTEYHTKNETGEITFELSHPIRFEATIENGAIVKDENYNLACQKVVEILQTSGDAFKYDYPEVFWIRYFSYSFGITAKYEGGEWIGLISAITVTPNAYYNGAVEELDAYEEAVQKSAAIIKELRVDDSDYETLKTIHDYLCSELTYHYKAAEAGNSGTYLYAHTSSTAFIGDKQVVCEGYAKAFKVLCDRLDISCALVSGMGYAGNSGGGHMWNAVRIDGKWYAVDVTWDDGNIIGYEYFLVGNNTKSIYDQVPFSESHVEDGDFSGAGIYRFAYPKMEAEKYEKQEDSYLRGDVDENKLIDIRDLRIVLRAVCGKVTLTGEQSRIADVTDNGIVDIRDLRKILEYLCGKIEVL